MKMTTLGRLCRNGVKLQRYRSLDTDSMGRVWTMMTTTNGHFLGLLWESDLTEDRIWLGKVA